MTAENMDAKVLKGGQRVPSAEALARNYLEKLETRYRFVRFRQGTEEGVANQMQEKGKANGYEANEIEKDIKRMKIVRCLLKVGGK